MKEPGWPQDLPHPGTREFQGRVVNWLLDRGPGDLRTTALRRHPVALAAFLVHFLDGCLVGARAAYAQARVELGPAMEPVDVAEVMRALEAEGARLVQTRREVDLVRRALLEAAQTRRPQALPAGDA